MITPIPALGFGIPQTYGALSEFNPKDFGAVGDFVHDDTAAFNAAIAAASLLGGGIVRIPRGNYITGPWVVAADGVQIIGSGGATVLRYVPTANGPFIKVDRGGVATWGFRLRDVQFQSTDVAFTKEMVRLVDVRNCEITGVSSQDGLWNGAGSIGLRIFGRDLIRTCLNEWRADIPVKIELNPNLAVNALDFATFEHTQFAVSAGVNGYNVELADGVCWTNNHWLNCDAARGLGFARWLDTTSPAASFLNKFEGCRVEQAIAGASYGWDLESTAQQLQGTRFERIYHGNNINGIKLRNAKYTSMESVLNIVGDVLNMDATCRGLVAKNFYVPAGLTTTGLAAVTGYVEITQPDSANISGDRGDVNFTLVTLVDNVHQRVTSALTANRVVTLSALNAHRGAKFRVVRSGLGAFTLDVGGLKVIPAATAAFVDVEHDGTAWRLAAYGVL
jgi:hypothetical protein